MYLTRGFTKIKLKTKCVKMYINIIEINQNKSVSRNKHKRIPGVAKKSNDLALWE